MAKKGQLTGNSHIWRAVDIGKTNGMMLYNWFNCDDIGEGGAGVGTTINVWLEGYENETVYYRLPKINGIVAIIEYDWSEGRIKGTFIVHNLF